MLVFGYLLDKGNNAKAFDYELGACGDVEVKLDNLNRQEAQEVKRDKTK